MEKTMLANYKSFCLEFLSGKYKDGHFVLPPDKEITIGRSGDIDLVIDENLVSRRHARISTQNGKLTVHDIGSTNGTFINGIPIKESPLAVGDRILIGESLMRVIHNFKYATQADLDNDKTVLSTAEAAHKNIVPAPIEGNIQEIPLPDLVQMLCSNKKTGILKIEGQYKGFICINEGDIWDADIINKKMPALKAWWRLLAMESGRFKLEAGDPNIKRRLNGSPQALILEGIHQADEMKSLICDLPDLNLPLRISRPLKAPLKNLSPVELDLLQALHNHDSIEAVLALSTTEDYKICLSIVNLLKKQYLQPGRI